MQSPRKYSVSRRDFSEKYAAASPPPRPWRPRWSRTSMPPKNNTIQVALIGCGGRGTGAAANALSVKHGPVKLVAMADVFPDRLERQLRATSSRQFGDQVDVPQDRQFIGFDAYQKAMDCLKPGDMAIFATPLAFRWVHFTYAIEKGLNVFMEKPLTADGPTSRSMFKLGRRGGGQEPQGGRGLDVPSQPRHAGTGQAHPGRRDRRHHPHARLPHARARRIVLSLPKPAGITERGLPDPALPQLHLGQRRLLQRLLHPHHRSLLLDEERLAGQGPGAGRPPLSRRAPTWIRTSIPTRWNTRFADGTKFIMDGRCIGGLRRTSTPASCTAPRAWRSFPARRLRAPSSHVQGPRVERAADMIWESKSSREEQIPIRTNGTTWWTPSATTSPTTRSNAASKPAW